MLVVEDLRRENEAPKAFLDKEMERLERPRAVWEPWYSWMRVKVDWYFRYKSSYLMTIRLRLKCRLQMGDATRT